VSFDQNATYLFGAYAVFLGGIALYLASLFIRKKNIERDEALIRQIEAEAETAERHG
jgi:hypothetical protein